jgi:hypothetical protein
LSKLSEQLQSVMKSIDTGDRENSPQQALGPVARQIETFRDLVGEFDPQMP